MTFDNWLSANKERLSHLTTDEALRASWEAGFSTIESALPSIAAVASLHGFELKQTEGGFICGIYPHYFKAPNALAAIATFAAHISKG